MEALVGLSGSLGGLSRKGVSREDLSCQQGRAGGLDADATGSPGPQVPGSWASWAPRAVGGLCCPALNAADATEAADTPGRG